MRRRLVSRVPEFFAVGIPSTKGSARAFVRGGHAIVTNDAGQKAKVWASCVTDAASTAMGGQAPISGAVEVEVLFYLPRPKAHFTKRGLREDAPTHSPKKPDVDKLVRCFLDALIGVVIVDDALIASLRVEKRYADGSAGALCRVRRMTV